MIVNASVLWRHFRYIVDIVPKPPEYQDSVPMSACPFCKISIPEELTLYGGHCPACVILIPGEETATDPGVEITSPIVPSTKTTIGGFPIMALAVGLLLGFGAGGWWWVTQRAEPDVAGSEVASGLVPTPLSAHEDQDYGLDKGEEKKATKTWRKGKRSTVTKRVDTRAQAPAAGRLAQNAAARPANADAGLGAAPRDVFSTIGAAPKSRGPQGIVLKDSLKIEEMIGRVLNRGAKQLEHCYTKALKMNQGLKGAWYVDFTISAEGKPTMVSVEALGAGHGGIEACIHKQVGRWKFQRIGEPVDVARTYRFGS